MSQTYTETGPLWLCFQCGTPNMSSMEQCQGCGKERPPVGKDSGTPTPPLSNRDTGPREIGIGAGEEYEDPFDPTATRSIAAGYLAQALECVYEAVKSLDALGAVHETCDALRAVKLAQLALADYDES
jgi:hypothetical protein